MPMTPPPAFSSSATCRRLDESHRKIEILVAVGAVTLIQKELASMTKAVAYLRSNFDVEALAKGPVHG